MAKDDRQINLSACICFSLHDLHFNIHIVVFYSQVTRKTTETGVIITLHIRVW